VLLACASLLVSAFGSKTGREGLLFFGLWRLRHVAVAGVLGWSAIVLSAWSRHRRIAAGLVLSTVALAIALLVAEAIGFFAGIDWNAMLSGGGKLTLGHSAIPHLEARGVAQQDIALSCGLEFERVPYHFRADQRGFRNELDRDAADLYLLGDSFIVAGLVPAPDLVGSLLEARSGRTAMNVALSGISPQAERDLLLGSGLPLEGRLVLHFVFEGNDLVDSAAYQRGGPTGVETSSFVDRSLCVALTVYLQRATERWVTTPRCSKGLLGNDTYLFGWLRSSFAGFEDQCQVVGDTLLGLREEVRRRGGEYAVVLIPAKIRVLGPFCTWPPDSTISDVASNLNPLRAFLEQWSQEHEVPLLDLTEPLIQSVEGGRVPWFPGDTHWNSVGHAVAAEAIVSWPPFAQWLARRAPEGPH
jgi:SGNH hydrolase-like domain, acetyltransferase AlgX